MTLQRDQAIDVIQGSRVGRYAAPLAELLEPSIRLGVRRTRQNDLPLGASRIGGLPDLPRTLAWPRFGQRPLALMAQLRLEDLATLDSEGLLPKSGWLYFFFDTANETPFEDQADTAAALSWRVLYFDGALGELERTLPAEPREERNEFPPFAVAFRRELTLPSFGSTLLDAVNLAPDAREDYEELVFALHARPPLPGENSSGTRPGWRARWQHWWIGDPIHRVLGHPEHFQVDPRTDWQRLEAHRSITARADEQTRHDAREWLLLLQVDTFRDGPHWLWGDNATFYYGIRREDLSALQFDRVQWTVECG